MNRRVSTKPWMLGVVLACFIATPLPAEDSIRSITRLPAPEPSQPSSTAATERPGSPSNTGTPDKRVLSSTRVEDQQATRTPPAPESQAQAEERQATPHSTRPPAREQAVTRLGEPEPEPTPEPEPEPDLSEGGEGAPIAAYDELLAQGVEAAEQEIDELGSLQLREWIDQMKQAVDDHPTVRVARLQAQASEAGVDQARAGRLPQITLSGELGNERSVRAGDRTAAVGGLEDDQDLQLNPTVDADLVLFDGGATRSTIDAAERRVLAGDVAAQSASDEIAFRAADTLIDLATLRAQIQLAEENLSEVRRLRAMIQQRSDAGRDSPSDMFRMNARVDEARNTLEQRRAEFNAARASYAEVFRAEPIILGLPPVFAPVPTAARDAMERSGRQNPDLLEAEALAEAAQRDFSAAQASLWPEVSLGASVTGFDVTREGEDFYDSFIGLRVNTPLYDGGSRRAQIDQARRQANLQQAQVDDVRANVVRAISEAYSQRASLRPRLDNLADQVQANRSTLEAYEEQFFSGRRPLNDLVTAQRELFGARVDLVNLRGELHRQHFSIRRLTGDLLSNYGLPGGEG